MVIKLLLLALLPWAGAFQSPWLGAASKRDLRLHSVTVDSGDLRRPPIRVPSLDDLLPPPGFFPVGLYEASRTVMPILLTLEVAGVDVGEVGDAVKVVGSAVLILGYVDQQRLKPGRQVRAKLRKPFNPPASNPWPGKPFKEKDVLTFVENNAIDKTLVLVDPSGTAKRNLLDAIFRGQTRIIVPAMEKLTLSEDLCEFFDLPGTKGLDTLADLIKDGINPDLYPVTPAKLLVDLVDVDDDTKIRSVVKEVKLLKEKAGTNVITIVVVANGASIQALPPVTQNALQVLS